MDKTSLLNEMDGWTVEERLDFIDAVYERLAASGWSPAPSPQDWAEIESRLAAHAADPSGVLTWEEVETRLKARK